MRVWAQMGNQLQRLPRSPQHLASWEAVVYYMQQSVAAFWCWNRPIPRGSPSTVTSVIVPSPPPPEVEPLEVRPTGTGS
ncbi:hypothetical protein NMG60_11027789 [Bertholletia excelsa]